MARQDIPPLRRSRGAVWSWLDSVNDVPEDEWQVLLSQQTRPSPFLSADFLIPWCASFVTSETPQRVGLWRRQGQLSGLIALYGKDGGFELTGGQDVADRLDALVEPGQESNFWQGFFAQAQSWQINLRFPNLAEDSPLLAWLTQEPKQHQHTKTNNNNKPPPKTNTKPHQKTNNTNTTKTTNPNKP